MMTTTTKPTLESLLSDGRRLLAEENEACEIAAEERRARAQTIFGGARIAALRLLDPLGAHAVVEPTSPHDYWDPTHHHGRSITFRVRPFGDQAGAIQVTLHGRRVKRDDDTDEDESRTWQWDPEDSRPSSVYEVECQFYVDDDYGVGANRRETTGNLALAVALCERFGEQYRETLAKAQADKLRSEQRRQKVLPEKSLTPGERLLTALADWHAAQPHDGGE